MVDVVIGLDLGTGGVRAIAVDLQGRLIAQTTRSYPLLTPPGWTEQNPADWVTASLDAPFSEEGAAYGAAILAMVGIGAYPNL